MAKIGNRVLVAAALLAVVAVLFWTQSVLLWKLITFLVILIAAFEWARLMGLSRRTDIISYTALFGVLTLVGDLVMAKNFLGAQFFWALMIVWWSIITPWWALSGKPLSATVGGVWGMLILFAAWHAGAKLFEAHAELLLLALVMVWSFDTAAFFAGRKIGKTPLAPVLSPKKTQEGFLSGWIAVLLCALFGFYWLGIEEWQALLLVLPLSFFIAFLATWGDLFESYMKRKAQVKDSGSLLGGHGGVLDRLDATIPVLPFVGLLAEWLVL